MHWPKPHIFQTSLWLDAQAHEIDLPSEAEAKKLFPVNPVLCMEQTGEEERRRTSGEGRGEEEEGKSVKS